MSEHFTVGPQIDQDLRLERRTQVLERCSWLVMSLILLAALVGVFGTGPISTSRATSPDGLLELEYDRFVRRESPQYLRMRLGGGAVVRGQLRLWLSKEYLDAVAVERVEPQPERVELAADGYTYVFGVGETELPVSVKFSVVPERAGRLKGRMRVGDGEPLSFSQLAYP